jgi:hypothetical protein
MILFAICRLFLVFPSVGSRAGSVPLLRFLYVSAWLPAAKVWLFGKRTLQSVYLKGVGSVSQTRQKCIEGDTSIGLARHSWPVRRWSLRAASQGCCVVVSGSFV